MVLSTVQAHKSLPSELIVKVLERIKQVDEIDNRGGLRDEITK